MDGDVRSDLSVVCWLVRELIGCLVDALTQGKRVGIVHEVNLLDSSLAFIDGTDTWVLLVEPRSLHISLLLWIVVLGVDLTNEVGDLLDAHLFEVTDLATCLVSSLHLEFSYGLVGVEHLLLSKVVSVLSCKVSGILFGSMAWDDSAKSSVSCLHWSVNEGQLSDVVLVDHAEDWLLLLNVDLGVLHLILVGGQQLSLQTFQKQSLLANASY